MKTDIMILNNFDYDAVCNVYDKLNFGLGTHDLISMGNPKQFKYGTPLMLKYNPMFHRIIVEEYTGGVFYVNPDCELRLVTESIFLSNLAPDENYEKLMSTDNP